MELSNDSDDRFRTETALSGSKRRIDVAADSRLSTDGPGLGVAAFLPPRSILLRMRDEDEIREQYEFLKEHLESDDMRHDGVEEMFTYYKRAIGWVLEEEHI
ncbi:hypothetical protein CP557_04270 [Natrinema ejinorense]|uniref:Uncharacterized protein n=1 Tax=Natrinema ejinorense TaxID=373386 RepID=A0A2A5QSR5_9EURY|nr:hypothetical protein CP557_04270 [Natrinema ejinorense]